MTSMDSKKAIFQFCLLLLRYTTRKDGNIGWDSYIVSTLMAKAALRGVEQCHLFRSKGWLIWRKEPLSMLKNKKTMMIFVNNGQYKPLGWIPTNYNELKITDDSTNNPECKDIKWMRELYPQVDKVTAALYWKSYSEPWWRDYNGPKRFIKGLWWTQVERLAWILNILMNCLWLWWMGVDWRWWEAYRRSGISQTDFFDEWTQVW